MILKCLIIDDEHHALDLLSKYVEQTPDLSLMGAESNPLVALNKMDNGIFDPDVTFLDIDMPQLSGIQLAEMIETRTAIIFTTAYSKYAVNAFDRDAVDYLLKPISYDRFIKSVSRVREKVLTKKEMAMGSHDGEYFFVKSEGKGKLVRIWRDEITYIEAKANYLEIHARNESHLTYLTMKEMDERLSDGKFMRVHKSFMVNMQKVKAIVGSKIILEDSSEVDLGINYRDNFLKIVNTYLIVSKRKL